MKNTIKNCLIVFCVCCPLTLLASGEETTLGIPEIISIREKLLKIEFDYSLEYNEHSAVSRDADTGNYTVTVPIYIKGFLSPPELHKKAQKRRILNWKKSVNQELPDQADKKEIFPHSSKTLEIYAAIENQEAHLGCEFWFLTELLKCPDFHQIPKQNSTMGFYRFLWCLEDLGLNDLLEEFVNDIVLSYKIFETQPYWALKIKRFKTVVETRS